MTAVADDGPDPPQRAATGAADAQRHGRHALDVLRDPVTIRSRCASITAAVSDSRSPHFRIDRSRLDAVVDQVAEVTLASYPDLQIPLHSRWRHFDAGGVGRVAQLDERLAGRSTADQARARIDLSFVSVLLDAGAGAAWRWREPDSGCELARSEGLAVASWHAFAGGLFSADATDPLRVDAAALQRLTRGELERALQARSDNPLVGLGGRTAMLNRLGDALAAQAAGGGPARPARLLDPLSGRVGADEILWQVLEMLAGVWRHGSVLHGVPLGDVWPHPWAGGESPLAGRHGTTDGLVPFHKLSQWLSYSLIEPLQRAGIAVERLDALTALPEYRNGGLLLDAGVIVARDPRSLRRTWRPQDEFIVEWRALTVSLIDELAPLLRQRLGRSAAQLPLGSILEGGTWAAGRALAGRLRNGAPPLLIDSDGTVF